MKKNMMSLNPLQFITGPKDAQKIHQKLAGMAKALGEANFRRKAARQIVAQTRPETAVPEIYLPYRPLVRDGVEFFLAHLPLRRLLDVIVHQVQMDPDSAAEERLLELAKQFPTLHKLGQIIARNPNLDPGMKSWLIHLESGQYGTDADLLVAHIADRLEPRDAASGVKIDPRILSEASVGAVIPFRHAGSKGVFKVLKKNVEANLAEELDIFKQMAKYFEAQRNRYALRNFQFLKVFDDVREILAKEINLKAEQAHLTEAARFYEDTDEIVIPELNTLSDETMTAMAYVPGEKLSDADLTQMRRRECAQVLAESLICRPIFSSEEPALFHGDPHAGNILLPTGAVNGTLKIALLDWSLAGYLNREVRVKIVRLIRSVIAEDPAQICRCLKELAETGPENTGLSRTALWRNVTRWIETPAYVQSSLVRKAFWLLEQLSYEGVVFSADLMLFRKAIFTLEGVLHDLYPRFDLDTVVFKYMASLLAEEMPRRIGNFMFFQADRAEQYRSMLSNTDLHSLVINQYTAAVKKNVRFAADMIERQAQLMRGLFI